jgi:hypothetical protein
MSKFAKSFTVGFSCLCFLAVMAIEAQAFHRGGGFFGGRRHRGHCGCHSECGQTIGCGSSIGCGSALSEDAPESQNYNGDLDDAERERTRNLEGDRQNRESRNSDRNAGEESEGVNRAPQTQSDSVNGPSAAASNNESAAEAPREINNQAKTSSENVQGNPQP